MIVIQARENSTRFPQKWAHEIDGVKIIDRVYQACEQTSIRPIVFAVPNSCEKIIRHCRNNRYCVYDHEGDENDLIKRFINAMYCYDAERCLRITCDCPYHMPQEMEWAWKHGQDVDFCSNGWPEGRTTPDGVDCEVYSLRLLRWMDKNVIKGLAVDYRQHLPLCIYEWRCRCESAGFHLKRLDWPVNLSHIKTSIDTQEDIERMREGGLI